MKFFLVSRLHVALLCALVCIGGLPAAALAAPFAYVANREGDSVSEIDLSGNVVTRTFTGGNGPFGVAISPDFSKLYVSNFWAGTVSVIDAGTGATGATITGSSKPCFLALNPSGSTLYVPHNAGSDISVIDTATNNYFKNVTVGSEPQGIAAHPDGTRMYVANASGNSVSVVATATNTVSKTISVGNGPASIAADPTGKWIYATRLDADAVAVISTTTDTVVGNIPVGDRPWGVAFTADGGHAWVANVLSNNVMKINVATSTVVQTISLAHSPRQLALNHAGTQLVVTHEENDVVSIIDTTTAAITTLAVGDLPVGVAVQQIPIAPNSPNGLTATVIPTARVQLQWVDRSENERFFDVLRKTGAGSYAVRGTVGANVTSFTDSVAANTTYTYAVRARNAAGNSALSDPAPLITPALPPAPTDLIAEATSITQVDVDWTDNATGETSFQVERRASSGVKVFTLAANSIHLTDTLTDRSQTYTYKVRALNVMGSGPWSTPDDVPALPPPAAPSDLAFTLPALDAVLLTWTDNATDESALYLERSSTAGVVVSKVAANATSLRVTLSDRTREYTFRIRAFGISGYSAWSNSVTVPILPPPTAPSNLTVTAANYSKFNLAWSDNSNNESRFSIYRKLEGGTYALIRSVGANVTKSTDNFIPAGTYVYKVVAFNPGGSSESNEVTVVMPDPPAAPSGVNAEKSGSSVKVTWLDNSSTETHFVVERKINDGNWVTYRTFGVNVRSFTDSAVSAGNTYSYRVRAANTGGFSAYSDPGSITLP